jgi:hypothetical protein
MLTANEKWRDDAINWIHRHASELPEDPPTRWHVAKPSLLARTHALHIIRYIPTGFIPVELGVTLDRGIELDWHNGRKQLEIEILPDGSVEVLRCIEGETVGEFRLPKPDWRLGEAFVWLERD